jgi:putative endonuclease
MYYLYIIHSAEADKHFIACHQNPAEAVLQHNTNTDAKYTGKHADWKIVALFETSEDKKIADDIKLFITKQKSKKLLLKLLQTDFVPEGKLALLKRIEQSA